MAKKRRQRKPPRPRLTKNQIEWNRRIRLLKRNIQADRRKGWVYIDNPIPQMPGRITKKQLALLEQYRKADFRRQFAYKSEQPDMGYEIDYDEDYPLDTPMPGVPNAATRLKTLFNWLRDFQPPEDFSKYKQRFRKDKANKLYDILNDRVKSEGVSNVARDLDPYQEQLFSMMQLFFSSDDDQVTLNYQTIREIIQGRPMSLAEAKTIEIDWESEIETM